MPAVPSSVLSSRLVKEAAAIVGFDVCGIAPAGHIADYAAIYEWKNAHGYNADMQYMQNYSEQRYDPCEMVEGARSVICLLSSYNPSRLMTSHQRVARYAYGEDYHERVKRMLYQLIALLREHYPAFDGRPCTDTAPVAEKYWAWRAGLGWIGRNTLIVNPEYGSWCNLGEIITTWQTDDYDQPMDNRCGTCRRCQQACPNHALREIGSDEIATAHDDGETQQRDSHTIPLLDARRCASYHTIENRSDSLPDDIRLSNYIFGCDICQQACPYNQQAPARLEISPSRIEELENLATCDEKTFKHTAKHSALNRIKYAQLLRNRNTKDTPPPHDDQ